jgi:2'-5' RNA ligase
VAQSAFAVVVPEAEACEHGLRQRFDPSAGQGMPAHLTILFPFMEPASIDDAVLRRAGAALQDQRAFRFALRRVGRFPATAWLAPEPAAPFIALTRVVWAAFPAFPPFAGAHPDIVPHLTVANGDAKEAEAAAAAAAAWLQRHGAIEACCREVRLMENSSGRWRTLHRFGLPGD